MRVMTLVMLSGPLLPRLSRAAVRPKKVYPPVAATTASASPRTVVDPMRASTPGPAVTGSDSPVSALASTDTVPSRTVTSAGMAAPAISLTRSPGTSSVASSVAHAPSRLAVARGLRDDLRAATASAALTASWKARPALKN